MARSKCSKDLYKSFLQASSVRYTGKALSEVSPIALSHDSASRWLNNQNFRPSEIYKEVSKYICVSCNLALCDSCMDQNKNCKNCLTICDDCEDNYMPKTNLEELKVL